MILFIHDMLNHFLIHFSGVVFKTFLDDVAAELLFGELNDITHQLSADNYVNRFDFHFQNKLDNIVAKWVLDESQRIDRDLMCQSTFLVSCGGIDALLHYATAMLVTCNLHTLMDHGVI